MYLFLHIAVSIRVTTIMIIIIKNATSSIISTGIKLNKDDVKFWYIVGSISVVISDSGVRSKLLMKVTMSTILTYKFTVGAIFTFLVSINTAALICCKVEFLLRLVASASV